MTAGRGHHRLRHGLIVAEIAFALVILAGSVSLVRGLQRIAAIDPGWRPDGVLTGVGAPGTARSSIFRPG